MQILTAATWIYGLLAADATLTALIGGAVAPRIYRGMAPEGCAFPCVVLFYMPGGSDLRGVGTINIMVNGNWVVKAIDRNLSAVNAGTIADRIHTLIHGKSGGSVLMCVRDEPVSYTELVDGALYQHVGGVYRVIVQ